VTIQRFLAFAKFGGSAVRVPEFRIKSSMQNFVLMWDLFPGELRAQNSIISKQT